ncbi:MAG TPA: toxin-antitoxin system HicB family antitoxin [Geobacteraceae bacterium]
MMQNRWGSAQTPEAALKGVRKLVGEVVADMQSNEEPVPEPIANKHFSGKFMVRVPQDVHRQLVLQAAEAGVSWRAQSSVTRRNYGQHWISIQFTCAPWTLLAGTATTRLQKKSPSLDAAHTTRGILKSTKIHPGQDWWRASPC